MAPIMQVPLCFPGTGRALPLSGTRWRGGAAWRRSEALTRLTQHSGRHALQIIRDFSVAIKLLPLQTAMRPQWWGQDCKTAPTLSDRWSVAGKPERQPLEIRAELPGGPPWTSRDPRSSSKEPLSGVEVMLGTCSCLYFVKWQWGLWRFISALCIMVTLHEIRHWSCQGIESPAFPSKSHFSGWTRGAKSEACLQRGWVGVYAPTMTGWSMINCKPCFIYLPPPPKADN
jgi:hypothetical protein